MTSKKTTPSKKGAKAKRVALYLRVSTSNGQTTKNQRRELEEVAERSGWEIVEVYEDAGISGAKGRDKRPAFDQLCKDATARKFDLIAAWSVDRLGRSLKDLIAFMGELHALSVDLYLHQQAVDTTTPAGRALFQMMGVFAEFERSMISERVTAGLARAKAEGSIRLNPKHGQSKIRKPHGRPPVSEDKKREILDLRKRKVSIRRIAKEAKVSTATVQKVLGEGKTRSCAQK